jgi:transposase-like protein
MTKRKNKMYTQELKQEAVALLLDHGYSVVRAAESFA